MRAALAEAVLAEFAEVPAARALHAVRGFHGADELVAGRKLDLGAHERLGKITSKLTSEELVQLRGCRQRGAGGLRGLLGEGAVGGRGLVGLGEGGAGLHDGVVGGEVGLVLLGGPGRLVPVEKGGVLR